MIKLILKIWLFCKQTFGSLWAVLSMLKTTIISLLYRYVEIWSVLYASHITILTIFQLGQNKFDKRMFRRI
jgi:hypothetical protein